MRNLCTVFNAVFLRHLTSRVFAVLWVGIEKMVDVYQQRPSYADAATMEDTRNKLAGVRSTCYTVT